MSEPLLQAGAQTEKSSLWDKAPGWRNLIVAASALTLTALALPLLLPQSPDTAQIPIAAPIQTVAVTPMIALPAAPPPVVTKAAPAGAVPHAAPQAAALPPQQASPATDQSTPPSQVASLPPQQTAPTPDLSTLPVGTEIVSSGVLARINQHSRYNSQVGDLPPTITIISPPAHGKISIQTARGPARSQSGDATRIVTLTQVFYQSESGYVGQDSVTYKRTTPDPTDPFNANTYTVNIYVK